MKTAKEISEKRDQIRFDDRDDNPDFEDKTGWLEALDWILNSTMQPHEL